jgi:ABC-2 type transport system ATP-binding protein
VTTVAPRQQERTDTGVTKLTTNSEKSVVVKGLGKSFGDVNAVRGISFEVGRGEVVALLGPNGAGKTTTVDMLSTLTKPDQGTARIAGHDVVSDPAAVRRSIMLTGQQVALDDVLTGRENLVLFARLQGLGKSAARERAEKLLTEFDLQHAAERRVGTYSGGMRRRVDIACGLVVRPEVVFLDEPTTGLDPRSRQVIWDLVAGFKTLGISTLLTTQYLEEADALSDRIIVIDHGEIVAEGTADELKERTGGSYCEIVPRDLKDLPAVVAALGPLLPEKNRAAALASESDRIAMPAPRGPNTLVEALALLNAANIELQDIALRRPSLDDVFLALTSDSIGSAPTNKAAPQATQHNEPALEGATPEADGHLPNIPVDADDPAAPRARRSWVASNAKTLAIVAVAAAAVTAVSLFVAKRDSVPARTDPEVPAAVQAPQPASAPTAAAVSVPAAPAPSDPPVAAPPPAPIPAQAPVAAPSAPRAQGPASGAARSVLPPSQAPVASTPAAVAVTSPAVAVSPNHAPAASPSGAASESPTGVGAPHMPLGVPPGPVAPPPPAEVPPPPPPDPLQAAMSPLLAGLP